MLKRRIAFLFFVLLCSISVFGTMGLNHTARYNLDVSGNFSGNLQGSFDLVDGNVGYYIQPTAIPDLIFSKIYNGLDFEETQGDKWVANDSDVYSFTDGSGQDTPFSISMWVKPESLVVSSLIGKENQSNANREWLIYQQNTAGNLQVLLCTLGCASTISADSGYNLSVGVWTHLVVVYSGKETGNSISIYYNGTNQTINPTGTYAGMGNSNSSFTLGFQARTTPTLFYDGVIDEVCIWKRMLSPSEITTLYNNGNGTTCEDSQVQVNNTRFILKNSYDNSTITNFSVTISNSTFKAVNMTSNFGGTVGFDNLTLNGNFTVNFTQQQFFNKSITVQLNGTTQTLNNYLFQSYLLVEVFNIITGFRINDFILNTPYKSKSTTNGTAVIDISGGTHNITVLGSFWDETKSISLNNLSYNYLSFNVSNNRLNVTAKSYGTQINNLTVAIYRLDRDYNDNKSNSTTQGIIQFAILNGTYEIVVLSSGYSTAYQNVTFNNSFHQLNFSLVEASSFNFTFRDAISKNKLTYTTTTLELIGQSLSGNYSTTNGSLLLTLLLPNSYTLRYSAIGYPIHFYEFTLINNTFNNLNLYLHNYSDYNNVTVTVIDEYGDPVESAKLYTSRYDIQTNTDILQEICSTNFEGKCIVNMQLNAELYTFSVYYEGEIKKTVARTRITSNSYQISVVTGTPTGTHYFDFKNVDYSLIYSNTTKTFTFFYSDSEAIASSGCLYVYSSQLFGSNPFFTLINSSCATGPSSTLSLTILPQNNTQYRAEAYVHKGNLLYLGSVRVNYQSDTQSFQKEALLLSVILTLTILFAFYSSNPSIAVALMPMPVFVFTAIGILNLNLGVVTGFYVIILIFAFGIMER